MKVLLQPALLQEATDLSRGIEPDLGVVCDIAYKGKGLVGLQRVRAPGMGFVESASKGSSLPYHD